MCLSKIIFLFHSVVTTFLPSSKTNNAFYNYIYSQEFETEQMCQNDKEAMFTNLEYFKENSMMLMFYMYFKVMVHLKIKEDICKNVSSQTDVILH